MPSDFNHLKYLRPKFEHRVYCGLMKCIATALGFGENQKAQFRFHILCLFYDSGWKTVHKAFPNLSRPTVYRWKKTYEQSLKNLNALIPKSTRPKNTRKMQTPIPILLLVKSLRQQYPRMGKTKIKLFVDEFARQQGLSSLSVSTIGKVILRNKFFFSGRRSPKRKSQNEAKTRVKVCPKPNLVNPGYLQVDGVKFWYLEKYYYFLTGVEIVTKQAFVKIVPNLSSKQAAVFLQEIVVQCRIAIHTVQTDNGSEFEKYFKEAIKGLNLTHLFSYPHNPKTNGYVERFNWTIQDEFLFTCEDLLLYPNEFEKKLSEWMVYYNQTRPHQSLDYLSPYQYQEKRGFCLKSM